MLLKCLAQRLRISAFSVISVLLSALKKGSDPEKLSQRKSWEQGRFSHVISVSKTLELKCFIAQTWVPSLLEFVLHYSTNVIESVFLGKKNFRWSHSNSAHSTMCSLLPESRSWLMVPAMKSINIMMWNIIFFCFCFWEVHLFWLYILWTRALCPGKLSTSVIYESCNFLFGDLQEITYMCLRVFNEQSLDQSFLQLWDFSSCELFVHAARLAFKEPICHLVGHMVNNI